MTVPAAPYEYRGRTKLLFVFFVISDSLDLSTGTMTLAKFGASYMFGALLVAIIVVEINHLFIQHNLTIPGSSE
jgi:PTS system cellobiose-specific IIC component